MLSSGLVFWCCNILRREILLEYMYVKCPQSVCFPTSVLAPHSGTESEYFMHFIVTLLQ
jgi:hypothetical protein